jgi:putative transposase
VSIRQRLRSDQDSAVWLAKHCSDARFVYNLGLEQRNLWRCHRVAKINVATQMKELAAARQANDWLKFGSSSVQQAALRDLDRAFQNWWKNPGHFSHPTWRRAGTHEGFYVRDLRIRQINRNWGVVSIPKAGWVRFRATRPWAEIEAATSARVNLDRSGRWHISFATPAPGFQREPTGAVVGLDMGIAATVTTSNGAHLRMPRVLSPGETQRKRRLQRQLSRQQKGSNRRARTKLCLARLAAKEVDRRRDWIEQTTTHLVRTCDFIAVEDLAVKNMVRSAKGTVDRPGRNVRQKAGLNRSIHGQSWSLFRQRLADKALHATDLDGAPRHVELMAVNPAYTSQRCSDCGYTAAENRESQAIFRCRSCAHAANADVNAARNILAAGLAVSGRGGTSHAPLVPDRDQVDQAQCPDETSTTRNPVAA